MVTRIALPQEEIAVFCQEHHIRKLALFGSVLRDDFRVDSDIDVLVEFEAGHTPGLFRFVDMQTQLAEILGRPVDLGTFASVLEDENPIRRNAILESAQIIYEKCEIPR